MNEKRKKGNGYEEVKRFIMDRLAQRGDSRDPFVRITGQQIASALGITPQTVNEHVRSLVRNGTFERQRRFYFSEIRPDDPRSAGPGNLPTTFREPSGSPGDPSENLPGTFPQPSETFERPSENLPRTFPQPSENLLRRLPEGSNDSKKELQERKEKKEKEKCVDFLGDWIDITGEVYRKANRRATALFNKYGAGVRKGTSPVLINRFAAGFLLGIPLVNFEELEEQLKQAEQEHLIYESFRGSGQRCGIRKPFVRIANYLKKCFEADGWIWTKLTSPFENRLRRAHRNGRSTPIFPQLEEAKTQPVPKSTSFGLRTPLPVPDGSVPQEMKSDEFRFCDFIKKSQIGKTPNL